MFEHPIVDITLGLLFIYVILSLVCSAVQEWVAGVFGLRSKNLAKGIENLVGSNLAKAVYDHRLIKGLSKPNSRPSYISAKTFSTVLLEVVAKDGAGRSYTDLTADELRDMVGKIPKENPIGDVLSTLVGSAENEVEALKEKVADWFDEGMERIAGWYTRTVKYWLLAIAAVVVVATNANTLQIVAVLWENDALRSAIAAQAEAAAALGDVSEIEDARGQLETFPIGWGEKTETEPCSPWWWAHSIVGWLLTIAAVSLGAPFWFDLLGKVARLRASGSKPEQPKPT